MISTGARLIRAWFIATEDGTGLCALNGPSVRGMQRESASVSLAKVVGSAPTHLA